MTEILHSPTSEKDDLLARCADPRHLLLLSGIETGNAVFVNAISSNANWTSLKVWVGDTSFNIGWNGTRLSWTAEARKLYALHDAFYAGILHYLKGKSPKAVLMTALKLNAVDREDLREPIPNKVAVNQVIDLSDLVEPYRLFVRARSLDFGPPEFVTLKAGVAKKWTRLVFTMQEADYFVDWRLRDCNPEQAKVMLDFVTSISRERLRELAADRPVIDLRNIADQPHD